MLLVADVGNTNVVIGVYDGAKLIVDWRLSSRGALTADECTLMLGHLLRSRELDVAGIRGVAISSVVPALTGAFEAAGRSLFDVEPLVVTARTPTGMKIRYQDPDQVGADRIVNAVAAKELYGVPAIVVDLGTAITFDVISQEGEYIGGAIAPGIEASVDALFRRAARLPRVDLRVPQSAIATTTEDSIRSGVVLGIASLIDGMVERLLSELGERAEVVATGGLADLIVPQTRTIARVDRHLVLSGLRLIHERVCGMPSDR